MADRRFRNPRPDSNSTELDDSDPFGRRKRPLERSVLALAVVWSREEPRRVGEILLLPPRPDASSWLFGRGDSLDDLAWAHFIAQRPGINADGGLPFVRKLSRRQLELTMPGQPRTPNLSVAPDPSFAPGHGDRVLEARNVGQCRLLYDGRETDVTLVRPGDLLELQNQLLLLCLERPAKLPAWPAGLEYPPFFFGEADAFGIVGESPAAWAHRLNIAVTARLEGHTLILGPTGAGKESTAKAVHGLSTRRNGPFVSCDFKAIPEDFVSFELYGNRKSVPAGAAAREGLVKKADRGVLFLDEFGDIAPAAARDLRRFLEVGEFGALGRNGTETADVRVLGATNRSPDDLPLDVAARFPLRIDVPPLSARLEDIPLIARHLLQQMARSNPLLRQRFFEQFGDEVFPRVAPSLVVALLGCAWDPMNVRAINHLLNRAVAESLKVPELDFLCLPAEGADRGTALPDQAVERLLESASPLPVDTPSRPASSPSGASVPKRPGVKEPGRMPDVNDTERAFLVLLTDTERERLATFRRHAFHIRDACQEIGVADGTANDRLNELLFKALVAGDLCQETAARLVAGDREHKVALLQRRLEAAVNRLRLGLADEGAEGLRSRMQRRHRAAAPWVERVIDALLAGRL